MDLETVGMRYGLALDVLHQFRGPRTETFVVEPRNGTTVAKIRARRDDLAVALNAQSVTVTVEDGSLLIVVGRTTPDPLEVLPLLRSGWSHGEILVGVDTRGRPVKAELANLPSLLIAARSGAGKSVALHAMILSLVATHGPDTLRLILIDPKRLELSKFSSLPHLARSVVTEAKDTRKVLAALVTEMEQRYAQLEAQGLQRHTASSGNPTIVIVVDEWADIKMSSYGMEAEEILTRLAQKARAAGIHIILATQRPSVQVVTGDLKANFPARLALQCASSVDSRVILDASGAERLLGAGDALFSYGGQVIRVQVPKPSELDYSTILQHYAT